MHAGMRRHAQIAHGAHALRATPSRECHSNWTCSKDIKIAVQAVAVDLGCRNLGFP